MPFDVKHIDRGTTGIYLMHYDDFDSSMHLDRLTDPEKERYFGFLSIKRRQEFVATRILRHKIIGFEHIHYDQNGAPYIDGEGYISISHSKKLVGIALNKEHAVALDLESYRSTVDRVAYRFLADTELDHFDCTDKKMLIKIWSAKEALYKLAGRKEILFKEHLIVLPEKPDQFIGLIDNFDHVLKVKIDIFEHESTIITYNSEAVERQEHYDITKI